MSEAKPLDTRFRAYAWLSGVLAVGSVVMLIGYAALPLARDALTIVDATGPIVGTSELITESRGRGYRSYRKQTIWLRAGRYGSLGASPPKYLWVDDLDRIGSGQIVRFLVDPDRSIIYEATSEGRTLLAYAAAADKLKGHGLSYLLLGAIAAGSSGFGLWRRRRHLREVIADF